MMKSKVTVPVEDPTTVIRTIARWGIEGDRRNDNYAGKSETSNTQHIREAHDHDCIGCRGNFGNIGKNKKECCRNKGDLPKFHKGNVEESATGLSGFG
jgi:hypothetical protein